MDVQKVISNKDGLTQMLAAVDYKRVDEFRKEDADEMKRLIYLRKKIALPIDEPREFSATDLVKRPEKFREFIEEFGNQKMCALRLEPLEAGLSILRTRGRNLPETLSWFGEQKIESSKYRAIFKRHADEEIWGTIFVINEHGVFGELIEGRHHQLATGIYDTGHEPIRFSYDFKKWQVSVDNPEIVSHLKQMVRHLYIPNANIRQQVVNDIKAWFVSDYLGGYFETVLTQEYGLWFICYDRKLGKDYSDFILHLDNEESWDDLEAIKGQTASPGKIQGRVRVIKSEEDLTSIPLEKGEILVCELTTPDYVPLMKTAGAIVTDKGGVLMHAAVVSRELGVPCVVGTQRATQVFQDGDLVEVDADVGVVRLL